MGSYAKVLPHLIVHWHCISPAIDGKTGQFSGTGSCGVGSLRSVRGRRAGGVFEGADNGQLAAGNEVNAAFGVTFKQENKALDLDEASVAFFWVHDVLKEELVDDPAGVEQKFFIARFCGDFENVFGIAAEEIAAALDVDARAP
jgi:hypothetical protein